MTYLVSITAQGYRRESTVEKCPGPVKAICVALDRARDLPDPERVVVVATACPLVAIEAPLRVRVAA